MEKRLKQIEKKRIERRSKLLSKQQELVPFNSSEREQKSIEAEKDAQESTLAKINRLKQKMINQRNQEGRKLSQVDFFHVDLDQVKEHFAREIRPQIEKKYPGTPEDKIRRVTESKWNSISENKKKAYINKVKRKLLEQSREDSVKREEQVIPKPSQPMQLDEYINIHRNKVEKQGADQQPRENQANKQDIEEKKEQPESENINIKQTPVNSDYLFQ